MVSFNAEQPENYERKVPCAVVIDVSGSMAGAPIDEVNAGLKVFEEDVLADATARTRVDLAVVTFASSCQTARDFGPVKQGSMPTLTATGSTRLVDGVRAGVRLLTDRLDWYASTGQDAYRPYLLIITDGAPDADQDVAGLTTELAALKTSGYESPRNPGHPRKFNIFTLGVDGADLSVLTRLSPTTPLRLEHTRFQEFFRYLATVTKSVARSREGDALNLSPQSLGAANPFEATA
jgi:uncharacterized protein YegL